MSDESLREFQLNGKQLVFLFMASTIVAVVIFLCGVMVGRGVSTAQAAAVSNSTVETGDPTAGALPDPAPAAPLTPPSDVAPEVPGEDANLIYPETLKGEKRTAELSPATPPAKPAQTKPAAASSKAAVAGVSGEKPAANSPAAKAEVAKPTAVKFSPPAAPAPATAAPAADVDAEPAGNGFVVQVAATPRRSEADAIRARLQGKGYPAFVTTSGRLFRVRVGKYNDRAEADTVAKRLETQERFKPWVTR